MFLSIGDWIRSEREQRGLFQSQLAALTNYEVSQSAISQYERNEIKDPSIKNLFAIAKALKIPFGEIPWGILEQETQKETGSGSLGKERFSLYELPTADSIRTFEGKTYDMKGFIGIETETGEVEHVTDLYYRTKTVVSGNVVLAKRKNANDELVRVTNRKKLKAQ